jgi:hypothetical protein
LAASDGNAVALAGGRWRWRWLLEGAGNIIENINLQHLFKKKIPDVERSANKQSNAKSNNAITNNHEAHITPDGPANKQSDNKQSDAESD